MDIVVSKPREYEFKNHNVLVQDGSVKRQVKVSGAFKVLSLEEWSELLASNSTGDYELLSDVLVRLNSEDLNIKDENGNHITGPEDRRLIIMNIHEIGKSLLNLYIKYMNQSEGERKRKN